MNEKREVCTCEKCGNEAEMIVTCTFVDVEDEKGQRVQKKKETRKCTVCGNEADLIVDEG